jgi:DNA-binding MarR family transcriptional regulator
VAGSARNSPQLANELDIDWKTIDNHIEILTRYGLVEEKMVVGTAKYYIVTKHGRRVLSLLESEYCAKLTLRPKHFNWFYKKLAYVRPGSIEIPGCF